MATQEMKFTIRRLMFYVFFIALIVVTFGPPKLDHYDISLISGEGWLFNYDIFEIELGPDKRTVQFDLCNAGEETWFNLRGVFFYTNIRIVQLIGISVSMILIFVGFRFTRNRRIPSKVESPKKS